MTVLKYDLHSHSITSDGALTPLELVQRAKQKGVDVLALTDHDTTHGLERGHQAARALDIRLVSGVEVSVTWNGATVHVLGLCIDPNNTQLQVGLAKLREFRRWRAQEIARRLERSGIVGALDGVKPYVTGDLISRTHFAHFLVAQGYATGVRDVFKRFLVRNKPGHVPGEWATLDEAVTWIRAAGGQAVIAHPARYKLSAAKLSLLLEQFKSLGGVGLEVVSSSHNDNDLHTMARMANRFELLASCGSDYHGPQHEWVELGKIPALPEICQPIWSIWPQ